MNEPQFRPHVRRAVALVGSQHELARLAGERGYPISQQRISQLLHEAGSISSDAALSFHAATGGKVPASALRPDLWRSAKDVPIRRANGHARRKRGGRG